MNSYSQKMYSKKNNKCHQHESCKVYVGNIDPDWSEADIHSVMSKFGKITRTTIFKNNSGWSMGYGFVTFTSEKAANASFGKLDFKNRVIEIRPSNRKSQGDTKTTKVKEISKVANVEKDGISYEIIKYAEDKLKEVSNLETVNCSAIRLSKHSKKFIGSAAVSTSAGSRAEGKDITVKVIKLLSSNEQPLESLDMEPQEVRTPLFRKSSEKVKLISKYSKEFHPANNAFLNIKITAPRHPIASYTSCWSESLKSSTIIHQHDSMTVDHPRANNVDTSFHIAFFTYPGRD